jgi:hypothetical protein
MHARLVEPGDALRGGALVDTVLEGGGVDEGSLVEEEPTVHAVVRTSRPTASADARRALVDGDGHEHCTVEHWHHPQPRCVVEDAELLRQVSLSVAG